MQQNWNCRMNHERRDGQPWWVRLTETVARFGCLLAVLTNAFELQFQAAGTGCSSISRRCWLIVNTWLLQICCELLFKGWHGITVVHIFSVARPDRLTGCSLIKFTTLQWLDTPIDTFVTWIHCSVQRNDTYQQEHAVTAARQAVIWSGRSRISLMQCELLTLHRNRGNFSAETESLPKVVDQYSAENETCWNSSNCCIWRRNRKQISVDL